MQAFNGSVYVNNTLDVQHTPLYDTVVIAANTSLSILTSSLFTNVGPQSGKTLALTNLTQSGRLMAPEAFSIQGFLFGWSEDILRIDIQTILNQFCFEFYLGQKVYNRAPLKFYNTGSGLFGFSDKSNESVYTNGVPGKNAKHVLALPIVIDNQGSFYGQLNGNAYTLSNTSGSTGITFQMILDGYYARGVQ